MSAVPSPPRVDSRADALHRQILQARVVSRRSERELAVLLARFADERLYLELGFSSIHAYADAVLDLSLRKTRALLQIGRSLPRLPILDAALEEGVIGWSKARELLRVVTPETQEKWVDRAKAVTSRELERHVGAARIGEDPPPPEVGAKGPSRRRLVFEADAQDADLIRAALALLRAQADTEDIDDGALLAALARRVLHDAEPGRAPSGERYRTVLEYCPRCRQTEGIDDAVDATHVGLADCDGEVQEMRPGPKRGHLSRTIPPARRRAVLHRDRWRCKVPGCRCNLWMDVHHVRERHRGGTHDEANLIVLCEVHHRVTHDGLLAIRAVPGGFEFERSDGCVAFAPVDGTVGERRWGPVPMMDG